MAAIDGTRLATLTPTPDPDVAESDPFSAAPTCAERRGVDIMEAPKASLPSAAPSTPGSVGGEVGISAPSPRPSPPRRGLPVIRHPPEIRRSDRLHGQPTHEPLRGTRSHPVSP